MDLGCLYALAGGQTGLDIPCNITIFNLCLSFVVLVTGGSWYDVNFTVIVNTLVLIYIMLPGVRKAFRTY
jgi:hypothetical protein